MSNFINTLDILGDNAFSDAILEGTLEELHDDTITHLTLSHFGGYTKLKSVNLPKLIGMGVHYFSDSTYLESVSFSVITGLGTYQFNGCAKLTRLILRNTPSICTLSAVNCFTSTPIASGTGYIYVPRALVDSYKTATNWATYANQFRALEDYTVDGTVTGEIDESKI